MVGFIETGHCNALANGQPLKGVWVNKDLNYLLYLSCVVDSIDAKYTEVLTQ